MAPHDPVLSPIRERSTLFYGISGAYRLIYEYYRYTYEYSLILDTCRTMMVKFARKRGLDFYYNVAEIPQYFLDETVHADKKQYQLPEIRCREIRA